MMVWVFIGNSSLIIHAIIGHMYAFEECDLRFIHYHNHIIGNAIRALKLNMHCMDTFLDSPHFHPFIITPQKGDPLRNPLQILICQAKSSSSNFNSHPGKYIYIYIYLLLYVFNDITILWCLIMLNSFVGMI